jgi:hypothetical protein
MVAGLAGCNPLCVQVGMLAQKLGDRAVLTGEEAG